jgi:hypothetical protein
LENRCNWRKLFWLYGSEELQRAEDPEMFEPPRRIVNEIAQALDGIAMTMHHQMQGLTTKFILAKTE